jgi:hypothetical protein
MLQRLNEAALAADAARVAAPSLKPVLPATLRSWAPAQVALECGRAIDRLRVPVLFNVHAVLRCCRSRFASESAQETGAIVSLGAVVPESRDAVGAKSVAPQTPDVAPEEAPANNKANRTKKTPVAATTPPGPREGSKTGRVIAVLKRFTWSIKVPICRIAFGNHFSCPTSRT